MKLNSPLSILTVHHLAAPSQTNAPAEFSRPRAIYMMGGARVREGVAVLGRATSRAVLRARLPELWAALYRWLSVEHGAVLV